MKKCVLKITAISSLLLSTASLAAPSAEIKVTGELVAPTCQVTLNNNGVYDYGNISHTLVDTNKPVSLGAKSGGETDLHVNCSSPTALTFKVIDNRLGTASVAGNQNLGLGNVNNTGKLGYYQVKALLGRVDGILSPLFMTSGNTIPEGNGTVLLEHGKRLGWRDPSNSHEQAIGKDFTAMLIVEAFLAKRGDLNGPLGEGVNLDGSATLEFGFGL